jgi:pyruvate dehydrogenase E1 component alpha subunit
LWPLGQARIAREGADVTIVALGQMTRVALAAADQVRDSVSCAVIDLGTVRPWDRRAVLGSVARTRRLVTVEENPVTGGWGTDVVSVVASECHSTLSAPIARVTCPDVPVPFGALERAYLPSSEDVAAAVRHLVEKGTLPSPKWAGWMRSGPRPREKNEQRARRAELADPLGRYARMVEIRLVEDEAMSLFFEGLISGTMHTCQGQEAVAVGVAAALRPTDTVTCTYRGHGHALALGLSPLAVLAELLGRRDGVLEGKGGSMHLVAIDVGLLPTFAIVGAGIPVSAGAAYASQVHRDDAVAAAIFGDGAANIGAFHESLNLAAIWRLPALFICENNLYGEYSRIDKTTPVSDIASRAAAYAMPGIIVDGQDLDAVMAAVSAAADRARIGGGPTLLEMKTYRFAGHSRGDPAKYRPAGELEQWKARDPIALYEQRLIASKIADASRLAAIRKTAEERVAATVAAAKASPAPEPAVILEDV